MLDQLINMLPIIGALAFLSVVSYIYYSKPRLRKYILNGLKGAAVVFPLVAKRLAAKSEKFKPYLVFLTNPDILSKLQAALENKANKNLEDVKDDLAALVRQELKNYQESASSVELPELSDEELMDLVGYVFDFFGVVQMLYRNSDDQNTSGDTPEN